MTVTVKEQMTEVHNVLNTLVDSTEHLTTLAKAEEFEQSIYIFTSLIEGIEAVFKALTHFDIDVVQEMKEIEQTLPNIAKAFENEALEEIVVLSETSLSPALIAMSEKYETALQNIK